MRSRQKGERDLYRGTWKKGHSIQERAAEGGEEGAMKPKTEKKINCARCLNPCTQETKHISQEPFALSDTGPFATPSCC